MVAGSAPPSSPVVALYSRRPLRDWSVGRVTISCQILR
jgi:hypothetical protein